MPERSFVHLHVHTSYSLLDGAIRIKDLMGRCSDLGMTAVAMTDHGAMYGAVDFQKAAQKKDIKPIIGCEVYLAEGAHDDFSSRKAYHLTLLAKNLQGYKNLSALVSMGWVLGKHPQTGIPRVDLDLLRKYSEGLICLTGDLGGQVNQAILREKMEEARRHLRNYQEIFEEGHLFVELMDAPLPEFKKSREGLIQLAREMNLPVVATNDCHYMYKEDALAHAILMCIQLGKSIDIDNALSHGLDTLYLRSAEEMWEAFADIPEACENTLKIADMIDLTIPLGQVFLPPYDVPKDFMDARGLDDIGKANHEFFAQVAIDGLEARFEEFRRLNKEFDEAVYRERLDFEIGIIQHMDFPGYFLIVWDFINHAKEIGVPVGPGRGSGAGSLVAYAMRITDIDPIPYDLLFERFLNPERVSMPDFDIDFCMNRRGEVIDYVTHKYGEQNVGQIITYGQLKARACVKDVGRALGFNYADTDRFAKLIPDELGIKLQEALDKEPRLREACEQDPKTQTLFDIALRLENLNRQAGMHAAGIVISDNPLWETVPVCRGANDELVTQYAKNEVEEAGLVKFDFLGLKTLTVIDTAVRLINDERKRSGNEELFDIDSIPIDDRKVYEMISRGDTTGVFQLESSGFQSLLQKLKPDVFEDIVAAVALYRPGPLGTGMVDDFIDRKHGRKVVEYPHPWLEEVLKDTYGTIVYQEQVMKIAQVMAGYSLGGADLLRRAMGKKKAEVMDQQRGIFVTGSSEKGVPEEKSNEIFDLMAYFAGYGFNKSHSAAYALITYQTGYLKAHHGVAFMAALMTCDRENTDKVVRFINEAQGMGIQILPPDVNESDLDFSVAEGKIRFGMGAIKGVGTTAIEAIIDARAADGPFESLYDFCERVDLKRVNKRVLEAMIKSGGFDSVWKEKGKMNIMKLGMSRASMMAAIPTAMDRGQKAQKDKSSGQANLFGLFASAAPAEEKLEEYYPQVDPWTDKELLQNEKNSIGFYVTGHPLDRYETEVKSYASHNSSELRKLRHRDSVQIAGVITSLREKVLKSGRGRMAFVEFEDRHGQLEVICFSSSYGEHEEVLKSGEPLLLKGTVSVEGEQDNLTFKLRFESAVQLVEARKAKVKRVRIHAGVKQLTTRIMRRLATALREHPGHCRTELHVKVDNAQTKGIGILTLDEDFYVEPTDEMMIAVERIFEDRVITLH